MAASNKPYYQQQVDWLNNQKYDGRSDWGVGEVESAFDKLGLTPTEHYVKYGQSQGLTDPSKYDYLNNNTNQTGGLTLFGQDLTGLSGPQSNSYSQGTSIGLNSSNSESKGRSYSGLDQDSVKTLLNSLLPVITKSVGDMEGNIDRSTDLATGLFDRTGRNLAEKSLPGLIDKLSSMGVLNADTGKDVLADLLKNITSQAAGKSYESGIEAARLKAGIPSSLAPLLNAAQTSQSSSDSFSNGFGFNTSMSESKGQSNNDLSTISLLADVYKALL